MEVRPQSSEAAAPRWLWLVALVGGGFLVWTFAEVRQATNIKWGDTDAYLAHGLYIAEHGGLLGFLQECYSGTFPIVERHALFSLLLSPFASRTFEFFYQAKILNLCIGLAVLLSLIWTVARRYGRGPAVLAGLLYAVTSTLVQTSSNGNHDPLIALWVLWTWWFLTSPKPAPPSGEDVTSNPTPPSEMPSSLAPWALAGACLGLGYLTKSSAVLLLPAILAAGLWRERLQFLASPRVWLLLLVAAAVASPLLVRNVRGHGTLFYEGVNSHITWMDDWRELGNPATIRVVDIYGNLHVERNGLPTAEDYFRTHDIGDMVSRMARGVGGQVSEVMIKSVAPGFAPPSPAVLVAWGRGSKAWGLAVMLLAVAGWWLRRRSWEGTLLFFSTGAFMTFFAWNVLFPEPRYWAPLVPIWIGFAAFAAWTFGVRLMSMKRAWRIQSVLVTLIVALLLAWYGASGRLTAPHPLISVSASYLRFNDWVNRTLQDGDRVLVGPAREFWGLSWMVEPKLLYLTAPNSRDLESFIEWMSERRPGYLLMTPDFLENSPPGLQTALAAFATVAPDGSLVERQRLPGWELVYRDTGQPSRFIVYERSAGVGDAPASSSPRH